MKAVRFKGNDLVESDIPADMSDIVEKYREGVLEAVAETDEELLDKYFSGEAFTQDEILKGLQTGIKSGDIAPVFCGSAVNHAGVKLLLDAVVKYIPAFCEKGKITAKKPNSDDTIELNANTDETLSVLVFKTIVDPFVGKISYVKVMSGVLNSDSTVYNVKKDKTKRLLSCFYLRVNSRLIPTGWLQAILELLQSYGYRNK